MKDFIEALKNGFITWAEYAELCQEIVDNEIVTDNPKLEDLRVYVSADFYTRTEMGKSKEDAWKYSRL